MQISLIAVGRLGAGPEKTLIDTYQKRLGWSFSIKEIEIKKRLSDAERQIAEADALIAAIPDGAAVIALDERGKALNSREFAGWIEDKTIGGQSKLAILIGGADGLTDNVRAKADLLLSFGRLTWPHMLVRAMVAEQVYRAETILRGHPYHRD